ncbi:Sugar transporter [Operophtera brumata]|uniref:Sugar transporter n=1 Tax=Operophtera brumata TaxID=104452 RepID=A0A0L7LA83_OPEBR|nr:Sugar transporter [Operophtera brumata]
MVQGWLSPMISVLQSPEGPSLEPYTSTDISWTTSVYWQIKLFCLEPWAMILARAVAGIPCSACYIVLPIYLKEISDADLRDLLSVNTMLWLGLLVPTVVFFIFLVMPDTPEYLEAKAVLAWLRGVPVVDRGLEQDIDKIVNTEKQTKADDKSAHLLTSVLIDLEVAAVMYYHVPVHDRPTFKAFIITLVIKITQQFDGYLIVLIYAGFVFERASESITLKLSPNKQIMLIGLVQLVGSTMATAVVEKTGRKMLLVTTSFAVGAGMLLLAGWFYFTSLGTWLPGWLPLRGTVSSFANVAAKMSNFVQMKWFTSLCDLIGMHWTFLFFSVVSFFACFYSLVYFPETRQKTVEEIYEKLEGKKKENTTEQVP